MQFSALDLYTVSSGSFAEKYWNPYVTKFDTSSFYNWEQDNIPLYDLEERTNYLWAKTGFSGSSLTGQVYLVSGTAPIGADNVYTSVQDVVNTLPDTITSPTLIEVAVSGDLGSLSLDNIRCTGEGSLEIINRVFATFTPSDAGVVTSGASIPVVYDDRLLTEVSAGQTLSAIYLTSALTYQINTSSLWQLEGAGRSQDYRAFVTYSPKVPGFASAKSRAIQGTTGFGIGTTDANANALVDTNASSILIRPMVNAADSNVVDDTLTYELSSITAQNGDTSVSAGGKFYRRFARLAESAGAVYAKGVNGIITNNYFRSVTITNCEGPLYLRGFIVDGATGTSTPFTHYEDYGINVQGSDGITLENCGAIRSKRGGLYTSNSTVNLRRRFFSDRNYETLAGSERVQSSLDPNKVTYGIRADNSRLNVVQDNYVSGLDTLFMSQNHDVGLKLLNSTLIGGSSSALDGVDTTFSFCHNLTGIECVGSEIALNGEIDVFGNKTGLDIRNSTIKLDHFTFQYNEDFGIKSEGSFFEYGRNPWAYSHTGSVYPFVGGGTAQKYQYPALFDGNGVHMRLVNSTYAPYQTNDMGSKFGITAFTSNHGATAASSTVSKPAVSLVNSVADIMHPRLAVGDVGADNENIEYLTDVPVAGYGIKASDGSRLTLRGTKYCAGVVAGAGFATDKGGALIAAENNSSVNIHGANLVSNASVGVLADLNSQINVTPHKSLEGDEYDDKFDLSSFLNHTALEMTDITKGCLVVNEGSRLLLKDLGDARRCWGDLGDVFTNPDIDTLEDTSAVTVGGNVKFLPKDEQNATTGLAGTVILTPEEGAAQTTVKRYPQNYAALGNSNPQVSFISDAIGDSEALNTTQYRDRSKGGYCVRAHTNSTVKVENVNFLTGKPQRDGDWFDPAYSGDGCNDLLIWAITDNSNMEASYCAVSGHWPSEAGYLGPSSVYVSAAAVVGDRDNYNWGLAQIQTGYNDPSSMPEFKALSGIIVHDLFGHHAELEEGAIYSDQALLGAETDVLPMTIKYWGSRSAEYYPAGPASGSIGSASGGNYGPFRIYFEVDPACKLLKYINSPAGVDVSSDTRPYQTIAQGYFLSGQCSAINYDGTEDVFPILSLVPEIDATDLAVSGYYHPTINYGGPLLKETSRCVKLDESGLRTFANALHNTVELFGRPKLVDTYSSTRTDYGEYGPVTTAGLGSGFVGHNIFDIRRNS
jgi:hypothetical protein